MSSPTITGPVYTTGFGGPGGSGGFNGGTGTQAPTGPTGTTANTLTLSGSDPGLAKGKETAQRVSRH